MASPEYRTASRRDQLPRAPAVRAFGHPETAMADAAGDRHG